MVFIFNKPKLKVKCKIRIFKLNIILTFNNINENPKKNSIKKKTKKK